MKVKIIKSNSTAFDYSLGHITENKVYEVTSKMNGRYYIADDDDDIIWFHEFELEFIEE